MERPEDRLTDVELACTGESAERSRDEVHCEYGRVHSDQLPSLGCVTLDASQASKPTNKQASCYKGKRTKCWLYIQETELYTATKLTVKIMLNNKILLLCFGASADLEEGTTACLCQAGFL